MPSEGVRPSRGTSSPPTSPRTPQESAPRVPHPSFLCWVGSLILTLPFSYLLSCRARAYARVESPHHRRHLRERPRSPLRECPILASFARVCDFDFHFDSAH